MSNGTHQHDHRDPACLEVFAMLSEYLDGDLDDFDCRHIEEHIADCPPCIDFIKSLRKCVQASHDFKGREECPPIPPELEGRLKAAWQAALARNK